MGPFPGRFLKVSVGVMPDSRPTTPKTISLDTRLMSRWMTSFMQCGGIITDVQTGSTQENSRDKQKTQSPKISQKIKSASNSKIKEEESLKAEECSIEEKKPARKRGRRKAR